MGSIAFQQPARVTTEAPQSHAIDFDAVHRRIAFVSARLAEGR
jgi:hypothetical protein